MAYQLDVGVSVQIGIGVELACRKLLNFALIGSENVCQTRQLRVLARVDGDDGVSQNGCGSTVLLSYYTSEVECELVLIREAQQERWRRVETGVRILGSDVSMLSLDS